MKLWRRVVTGVLVVAVGVPLVFAGMMYGTAWYKRAQAQKLLTCLHAVRMGVTTEDDFHAMLRPAQDHMTYSHWTSDSGKSVSDQYDSFNSPHWIDFVFEHTPDPLRGFIQDDLMLDSAMFSVDGKFQGGVLTALSVIEFSCPPRCGHPFSTVVQIYAHRESEQVMLMERDGPFTGYQVDLEMLDHWSDRPLPKPVPFHQRVFIDERATEDQRRKALDFHLQCFTRWFGCRDATQMLQPAPNR